MSSRRQYDRQFKIDAVVLLERSGKTAVAESQELGIKSDFLLKWKKNLMKKTNNQFQVKVIQLSSYSCNTSNFSKSNAIEFIQLELLPKVVD